MNIEVVKRIFFAIIGFRLVANFFLMKNISPTWWRKVFDQKSGEVRLSTNAEQGGLLSLSA